MSLGLQYRSMKIGMDTIALSLSFIMYWHLEELSGLQTES